MPTAEMEEGMDVLTGYADFFESEYLRDLMGHGHSVCRFIQGGSAEKRTRLSAALRDIGLKRFMIYADVSIDQAENISDVQWLTETVLKTMEVSFHGRLIQSLPEILVAAPLGFQGIQVEALRMARLPNPGFKEAMVMALEGGRWTKPQWETLSGFLQGNTVHPEMFEEAGLPPLSGTLSHRNYYQTIQTVVQGLRILGFNGIFLTLNERSSVFVSKAGATAGYLAALRIQRMIDACVNGKIPYLALTFIVLPGFLETCAVLCPSMESKLFLISRRNPMVSWRWPVLTVEDVLRSCHFVRRSPTVGHIKRVSALEALRFGMAPEGDILRLTEGMEDFQGWARTHLEMCEDAPGGFEIAGRLGQGKSHGLALIRNMAKEQGFLTADIVLDGQDISFTNPAKFMNQLWQSLRHDKIHCGMPLLDLHIEANRLGIEPNFRFFCDSLKQNLSAVQKLAHKGQLDKRARLVESILAAEDHSVLLQSVEMFKNEEDEPVIIQNKIVRQGAKMPEAILENLGYYAQLAQLAGFRGLIVTVDGFETEYRYSNQYLRLIQTMHIFGQYFRGELDLPSVPLGLFISCTDEETRTEADDDLVGEMIAAMAPHIWRLKEWDSDRRIKLAEKIHTYYCEAYQWNRRFDRNFAASIESAVTARCGGEETHLLTGFIKFYIGLLDLEAAG
jgi:hypothetical protein